LPTTRQLSQEGGIGDLESTDLGDSLLRQLKEMLNGLQGKDLFQLKNPDFSPQRPSRDLH
jgi:hypothetical protein